MTHSKQKAEELVETQGETGERDVFEKEITLYGDLTDEQRTKLHDVAAKCPVQRTLESHVIIHTR